VKRDKKGDPLERIDYIDVCSLYPYSNKYGEFPVGHPEVILENFKPINKRSKPYNGLIKCAILPPKKLLHPLLPYRSKGKMLLPLCAKCADQRQKKPCCHSDKERMWTGTYVSIELYKALELGYKVNLPDYYYHIYIFGFFFKIVKVFEVWHFTRMEKYDPVKNPSGGLFTFYINLFMKQKIVS